MEFSGRKDLLLFSLMREDSTQEKVLPEWFCGESSKNK